MTSCPTYLKAEEKKLTNYLSIAAGIDYDRQPNLLTSDLNFPNCGHVLKVVFDSRNFELLDVTSLEKIVTGVTRLEALDLASKPLQPTFGDGAATAGSHRYWLLQ